MFKMAILFFLVSFASPLMGLATTPLSQLTTQQITNLANSPSWIKLLHYQKTWTGSWKSTVDRSTFFLSPNGKSDPLGELRANIKVLFTDSANSNSEEGARIGIWSQTPICAFPARIKVISNALGLEPPSSPCLEYQDWKASLSVSSVDYVYSSAYSNNPASLFGHTFLKLNRGSSNPDYHTDQSAPDLLSYGLNFAADSGDSWGAGYVFKGLFGGFDGLYNLSPFFQKVNEYVYSEGRDLWIYPLNLDTNEIAFLVEHLWELLGTAAMDYYFLDENCSYQILAALEAVRPESRLVDGYPGFVLPTDTIRRLIDEEWIKASAQVRYSKKNQFLARVHGLPKTRVERLMTLIDQPDSLELKDDQDLLDSLVEYYQLRKIESEGQLSDNEKQAMRSTLLARAQAGELPPARLVYLKNDPPHLGHPPQRLAFGPQIDQDEWALFLNWRWGVHDRMNSDEGFIPFNSVEVFKVDFVIRPDPLSLRLEEFKPFEITSLTPVLPIETPISWWLRGRFGHPRDLDCAYCNLAEIIGGAGFSWSNQSRRRIGYALLTGQIRVGGALQNYWQSGPGMRVGGFQVLGRRSKLHMELGFDTDLSPTRRNRITPLGALRLNVPIKKSFELRSSLEYWKNPDHRTLTRLEGAWLF